MKKTIKKISDLFLKDVKTTKDLIYKDKTINEHNILGSYEAKCSNKEYAKSFLIFGDSHYYYNNFDQLIKLASNSAKVSNKLLKDYDLKKKFLQSFYVSEIQNSLWIEGVKSSRKKIKQILKPEYFHSDDSNYMSKIISNFKSALEFIMSTDDISEANIFTLYNILSKDIDMGEDKLDGYPYRQGDVQIGKEDRLGLDSSRIKESMNKMIEFIGLESSFGEIEYSLSHFLNAFLIHLNFEHIHPYYDMNGRMGRLLSLWFLRKVELLPHFAFFSQGINLYKEEMYYKAFSKIEEKNFKFDATYFVASMLAIITTHNINLYVVETIEKEIKRKHKYQISDLEKEILISLISKDDNFYKKEEIILGVSDITPSLISKAFTKLTELELINVVNGSPKQYAFNFEKYEKDIDALIKFIEQEK